MSWLNPKALALMIVQDIWERIIGRRPPSSAPSSAPGLPWRDVKIQNDASHVPEEHKLRKTRPVTTGCTACGGFWVPSSGYGPLPGERCPRCIFGVVSELEPPSSPTAN